MSEQLDNIKWRRRASGFEVTLGKYILKKTLELAKGPRVLDVGCGDGLLTKQIADHFKHVVGIDGSSEKIRLAKEVIPNIELYACLFEDFEIREKFDSIIMINLLEHIENAVSFLEKARNLLNPSGCIIIFVPNALSLNRRIGERMGIIKNCYELTENDVEVGHKRFYDKESLNRDIIKSGLKVKNIGGLFLKPLSNKQMESWSPEVCEALYYIGEELPDYCGLLYAKAVL